MAVLTNVFRRGGVFYFRARVPAQLRARVRRAELWRSLKTCDTAQARRRGRTLHSLTEALWSALQRVMTEQEAQALIDGWLKAELDEDRDVRRSDDPAAIAAHEAEDDLSGGLWRKNRNDPSVAARHVDELVTAQGLTLTEAERDMMIRMMMRAHVDLCKAVWARSAKLWRPWLDDDPAAPLVARLEPSAAAPAFQNAMGVSASTSAKPYGKLSEVAAEAIPDLARQDGFSENRENDYRKAVELVTFALGRDPDLGDITPDMAGSYARDLTWYPSNATKRKPYRDLATFSERVAAAKAANDAKVMDPVTINNKYLTPLRRIYEWRKVERRDLTNPFKEVTIKTAKRQDPEDARRDFSKAEVVRLFGLPLFTGSKDRKGDGLYMPGNVKVDDWRVWVPLICLFSGMRLNEACGLAVADIRQDEDGIHYFHVRDESPGQRIKSNAARRKVPIHDQLVQIDFLKFSERQKRAGRTRIFEELTPNAKGYFSGVPSQWFNRLLDRIEDVESDDPGKLVFHSTRHTVVTKLRSAGVAEDVRKEVVGHEKGETHANYGTSTLPFLQEVVNKIAYPGLDLTAVRRG